MESSLNSRPLDIISIHIRQLLHRKIAGFHCLAAAKKVIPDNDTLLAHKVKDIEDSCGELAVKVKAEFQKEIGHLGVDTNSWVTELDIQLRQLVKGFVKQNYAIKLFIRDTIRLEEALQKFQAGTRQYFLNDNHHTREDVDTKCDSLKKELEEEYLSIFGDSGEKLEAAIKNIWEKGFAEAHEKVIETWTRSNRRWKRKRCTSDSDSDHM